MPLSIEDLKKQRRWVLWKLEHVGEKDTKVPYQPNGRKAMSNNPDTWITWDEAQTHLSHFSGVGCVLGEVGGVYVWGVDLDKCADAVSGKFTAEAREVIIELNSYAEYSPSGDGAHILGVGPLPSDKPVVKPYPGCKQIEIKGKGYYFTYTARHLGKTPAELMDRGDVITALYRRVEAMHGKTKSTGMVVKITADEATRFKKLWDGDMSDYDDDHSRADLALVGILAKRCNNNPFLIDQEFCKSGLYREKWDRLDYKGSTIGKVIKGEPVFSDDPEETFEEDGETEYLVNPLVEENATQVHEGWFPKGEVSLIGGASGAGKTSWGMPILEKIRLAEDVYGHTCKSRDYRVLLHDRSKKAMHRTIKALHLSREAIQRVVRLTPAQQQLKPDEILDAAIDKNPGVEVWFIEGLDLWIRDMNKMEVVSPIIDGLQRIATRRDIAVIGTVGAPKQKGKDRYYGRDSLFGSSSLARKVETVVLMELHDQEDSNSVRRCTVLPRNGRAETLYFEWRLEGLMLTSKPDDVPENTAMHRMTVNVFAAFKPGEPITYQEALGPSSTFYKWRKWAIDNKKVVTHSGKCFVPPAVPK